MEGAWEEIYKTLNFHSMNHKTVVFNRASPLCNVICECEGANKNKQFFQTLPGQIKMAFDKMNITGHCKMYGQRQVELFIFLQMIFGNGTR